MMVGNRFFVIAVFMTAVSVTVVVHCFTEFGRVGAEMMVLL